MSAEMYEGFVAPAALANKKQMGEALHASASVHVSVPSRMTDFLRSIGHRARMVLDRLGLGALAQTVGEAVKGGATWLWNKAVAVGGYLTRLLGWKAMATYAVTDTETRRTVLDVAGFGMRVVKTPFRALGWLLRKVPLVGKPVVNAWNGAYGAVESYVVEGINRADAWLAVRQDAWYLSLPRGFAAMLMVGRVIARFVPGPLRPVAWIGVLVLGAWPQITASYRLFKEDPDVQRVKDEVLKPGAAKVQDIVQDRVQDGPKANITQPGTFEREVVEIDERGKPTGKHHTVTVEVDSRGHETVWWNGERYDWSDLGQAAKDPIRPVEPKEHHLTTLSKILVDADEAAARLRAATPKDGTEQVAASTGSAPATPRPPSRAVRRAAAAAAKQSKQAAGAASAGSGSTGPSSS